MVSNTDYVGVVCYSMWQSVNLEEGWIAKPGAPGVVNSLSKYPRRTSKYWHNGILHRQSMLQSSKLPTRTTFHAIDI